MQVMDRFLCHNFSNKQNLFKDIKLERDVIKSIFQKAALAIVWRINWRNPKEVGWPTWTKTQTYGEKTFCLRRNNRSGPGYVWWLIHYRIGKKMGIQSWHPRVLLVQLHSRWKHLMIWSIQDKKQVRGRLGQDTTRQSTFQLPLAHLNGGIYQ